MAICWIERVVNAHPTGTLEVQCYDFDRHPQDKTTGQVFRENDVITLKPGEQRDFSNFAVPWGLTREQCLLVSTRLGNRLSRVKLDIITDEAWDYVRQRIETGEEAGRVEAGSMGDLSGTNHSGWHLRLERSGHVNLHREWRQGTSRRDAIIIGTVIGGVLVCVAGIALAPIGLAVGGALAVVPGGATLGIAAAVGGTLAAGCLQIFGAGWITYWTKYNPVKGFPIEVSLENVPAAWITDLAVGQPATATSQYSPEYAAGFANDGGSAQTGGWSPSAEDTKSRWQVDLGTPCQLSAVRLVTRQDLDQAETRRSFEIWASNDPSMKEHVVLGGQGDTAGPFQQVFSVEVTDPAKYRYIAVAKTAPGYFFIAKLHVYGRDLDLAANKVASASSSYSSDLGPEQAVNGGASMIQGGGWSPADSDLQSYWQVDLGRAAPLARIDLATRQVIDQSETRRNFQIWGSNDPEMKTHAVLATQGSEPLPFKETFIAHIVDPTPYRYLRVVKTVPGYFFIAQLCVYGRGSAAPVRSTLTMGQSLISGESLQSANGRNQLIYQPDGNLVLYGANKAVLWNSHTQSTPPGQLVMQSDGNLVIYDASGAARWASSEHGGSYGPAYAGSKLVVQDDGNLVVQAANGATLWQSGTGPRHDVLSAGQSLQPGQSLRSRNECFRLVYQTDGNLVLYGPNDAVRWNSGTQGTRPGQLAMQSDGNLVVYTADGGYPWASSGVGGTIGPQYAGCRLVVQDDGNLVVYAASDAVLWQTGTYA